MKIVILAMLAVAIICATEQGLPAQDKPRFIEIHARRFEFEPAEITVRKGEAVTLSLISEDVSHSLLIEGARRESDHRQGPCDTSYFHP